MPSLSHTMQRRAFSAAIDVALRRLNKDREKGLLQIVDLAERFMGSNFKAESYESVREMIRDPENKWMRFVNRMLDEVDPHVAKMTALNLGFEAAFYGTKVIREKRKEYQCNIPWLILMDPTSACNMHCTLLGGRIRTQDESYLRGDGQHHHPGQGDRRVLLYVHGRRAACPQG